MTPPSALVAEEVPFLEGLSTAKTVRPSLDPMEASMLKRPLLPDCWARLAVYRHDLEDPVDAEGTNLISPTSLRFVFVLCNSTFF